MRCKTFARLGLHDSRSRYPGPALSLSLRFASCSAATCSKTSSLSKSGKWRLASFTRQSSTSSQDRDVSSRVMRACRAPRQLSRGKPTGAGQNPSSVVCTDP